MIILKDLSKRFDHRFVVEGVNLKIEKGEVVGLLGPNGAGKTTTLRMLAGVLPPTKGDVLIDGQDIHKTNGEIKKEIGFLPENNPLYNEQTVEEYLKFWADIKKIEKNKKKKIIDSVVSDCGLASVYYRPISEISKGFRQRTGLAQALLTKPEILILDEPTEGLDPNQRHDIADLIKDLGKERTVIISSHVLSEVAKICGRLIIIHNGKIVADDSPENLKKIKSQTQTIEVEIKGNKVISSLKTLKGVLSVSEKRSNYYILEIEKDLDLREEIFKLAVSRKWTLLTLMQKEREIEDVFSMLTT